LRFSASIFALTPAFERCADCDPMNPCPYRASRSPYRLEVLMYLDIIFIAQADSDSSDTYDPMVQAA
jgi:hypothetical protein